MHPVICSRSNPAIAAALVVLLTGLGACSTIDEMVQGDKIDYRSAGAAKSKGLEVPPDLSQLARDSRYQTPASGSVSAAALQAGTAAAAAAPSAPKVALDAVGETRIERLGNLRWLSTPLTPEQLWPQLQAFWRDSGLTLQIDEPATGVMETTWAENRAKLPQDFIRATIGRVFDSVYSTGELDKFRTRVERGPNGSEVYISHRGMIEVYRGALKDSTGWEARPSDPLLEAAMLSRLMVKLGAKPEQAAAAAATAAEPAGTAPNRARVVEGLPEAALQVDDGFDRAWRRVGLALDRSGFTVEDRDRALGLYYVRYIDPTQAGKEEPGFLTRLFSSEKAQSSGPDRYRIAVKSDGAKSMVSVLNEKGEPENGPTGKRIVALLVEALK
jgi:outer membrane protein assembly factor BamC